jgi:hypothetical protein
MSKGIIGLWNFFVFLELHVSWLVKENSNSNEIILQILRLR